MDDNTLHARMWVDLWRSEQSARASAHEVTARAEVFIACGLPQETVYEALGISRATWYRRVSALRAWEAGPTAAAPGEPERPTPTPDPLGTLPLLTAEQAT